MSRRKKLKKQAQDEAVRFLDMLEINEELMGEGAAMMATCEAFGLEYHEGFELLAEHPDAIEVKSKRGNQMTEYRVPTSGLVHTQVVMCDERGRETILFDETKAMEIPPGYFDTTEPERDPLIKNLEAQLAAKERECGRVKKLVSAYVKMNWGAFALTCEHDYEPNTVMTEMRCDKCGVDANLGEALSAVAGTGE